MTGKNKENPNAFKHMINESTVSKMAVALLSANPAFDKKAFLAVSKLLPPLELKQRVQLVRDQLRKNLPTEYLQALEILIKSLKSGQLQGFALWPYTEFIQTYGTEFPKQSLQALYVLTSLFTGEFAVRPFLRLHSEQTLKFLEKCAQDENVHVRRWASEGTRPRLPWGEKLHDHVKKPELSLSILEKLKHDPELYVRKSIANHLNDISKDNPQTSLRILKSWQQKAPAAHKAKIDWITRHALRSLIKAGHPAALALIGANAQTKVRLDDFKLQSKNIRLNQALEFEFSIQSKEKTAKKIIVDYAILFVTAHGKLSRKVFKLKTVSIGPGEKIEIKKRHGVKPITTRRYYSGQHGLEIQVNGKVLARTNWTLKL